MFPGALEPFYDSVMDDYEDEDDGDAGVSSGMKRLGMSLGLKLRPWEGFGVRSAKSEVSLIDFTDDSFSSNTPSPLTESQQDQDTLKVRLTTWTRRSLLPPRRLTSPSWRSLQDMPSILDWPLPQPAYDEVTAELEDQSEDQEVRSIYRALTEKEENASTAPTTAAAATARRNESQSADLFQELQREVEVGVCVRTHHVDRLSRWYCLTCPIAVLGNGEAAGSYGNRPLPPFLPSPLDSGPSGTTSTDLPARSVPLLRLLF